MPVNRDNDPLTGTLIGPGSAGNLSSAIKHPGRAHFVPIEDDEDCTVHDDSSARDPDDLT